MESNTLERSDNVDALTQDYHALNAMLNLYDSDGNLQLNADQEAIRQFFIQHVNPKTMQFDSLDQKLTYLVKEGYYEDSVLTPYPSFFLHKIWKSALAYQFRFKTFLGAFKYYSAYTLSSRDQSVYLESFEDRIVMIALSLARGDQDFAMRLMEEILSGRFQPSSPCFLNAGKALRGEFVSCFLLRIEDNMESIARSVNAALQLSKRGGGVALTLTNIREHGAPIKGIENQASGVIPIMKLLEDSFSYSNQLGVRAGAGAVYLNAHHPDILRFLDTKRENADEKIRIKTLSLAVVVPDITFELARKNEDMHLFSPHDVERVYGKALSDISISELYWEMVEDDRICKTRINARGLFQTIAEIQFESGYPYLLFEDTANRSNPIKGRISMSNLCSEILQVNEASTLNDDLSYNHLGSDISCNLGSLNIASTMDGGNLSATVNTAVRALTAVSEICVFESVPSVRDANEHSHTIGVGQMNLHGYLARERIHYGSREALDFTNIYFCTVLYHCLQASNELAREKSKTFRGFRESSYADGAFFAKYTTRDWQPETERVIELFNLSGIKIPSRKQWQTLRNAVMLDGLYNRYLQAVPPTGSISYINHATSSIHPITSKIEVRKEGKIGRVYFPAPYMNNNNLEYYKDAYEIGPEAIIDTYAVATQHIDQGLSLTLFFKDTATTRDINRAQIYAWRKGIKTIYYIRLRQKVLEGTEVQGCVSCAL